MNTELEESERTPKYRVESIEKIDPPTGMPQGDWFRYVIREGDSKIEGLQPGSLYSVTQHANTFADDLNARAANGYSVYSGRRKK